jgi:hypothetical protein
VETNLPKIGIYKPGITLLNTGIEYGRDPGIDITICKLCGLKFSAEVIFTREETETIFEMLN